MEKESIIGKFFINTYDGIIIGQNLKGEKVVIKKLKGVYEIKSNPYRNIAGVTTIDVEGNGLEFKVLFNRGIIYDNKDQALRRLRELQIEEYNNTHSFF